MQPQRVNIFYVLELLRELSDSKHILKMNDIRRLLSERYGVSAERRAVYGYINTLIYLGYDISDFDDNGVGYYLRKREMDEAEIRRMIFAVYTSPLCGRGDAVKASEKLMNLQSIYKRRNYECFIEESGLNVRERIDMAEKTDILLRAAEKHLETEIGYRVYSFEKGVFESKLKKYKVCPYAVTSFRNVLYLICSRRDGGALCHYRIDRIESAEQGEFVKKISPGSTLLREYIEEEIRGKGRDKITIRCSECVLDDLMETFGHSVHILTYKNKCFTAVTETSCKRMKSWAMKNLKYCEVIEPVELREYILESIENNAYRMQAGE